jgi:hypothetical protein
MKPCDPGQTVLLDLKVIQLKNVILSKLPTKTKFVLIKLMEEKSILGLNYFYSMGLLSFNCLSRVIGF